MTAPVPVHYLRENAREWSPPSVAFWDTETATTAQGDNLVERLRCWSAAFTDRRAAKRTARRDDTADGTGAPGLADWFDQVTRNRGCTWAFAHNSAFDLAVTNLPIHLGRRGWSTTDASIGGRSPWVRLVKGHRSLVLVDSWSWLPHPLGELGELLGEHKPPLPAQDAGPDAWAARCRADVAILATAMGQLLDWWDRERLGNWTISGPGCGWNAYRHRPATSQVVVAPDVDLVAQDRLAVHGGRRGVWQLGHHAAGPFLELDFKSAYPTIAATLPHPIGRAYPFDHLPLTSELVGNDRWSLAAQVRVRTDVPRWPVRIGAATWYPVGEFWADLAGPDIAEAARLGCLAEIGAGQCHKLGRNMWQWGEWVLATADNTGGDTPAMGQLAAKSWGRSVIGKWSVRGFTKTPLGPAPTLGWGYEPGWDHDAGVEGGMVDLDGQRWWVAHAGVPENAYPAVTAWIEAEVRVRLGRVIEAIGPGAILQCDTDGMIVAQRLLGTRSAGGHLVAPRGLAGAARVAWVLNCLDPITAPLTLRVKRRLAHVDVLGPQHLVRQGQRRFAGMPKDATETEPGVFTAHLWPGLQWQLQHSRPGEFTRPARTYHVSGPYPTGWVTTDRRVLPPEVAIGPDGANQLVRWDSTRWARLGERAADDQHKILWGLL